MTNPKDISKLNIHQRILGIMSELDYIEKGSVKVNNQYRFVSHDQVTAKIHPMLVKYGITILPTVEQCIQENNRAIVHLVILFTNADNPNDCLTIRSVGYGIDNSDKGPGKAISYAYKYALLKAFCLETGDDPDNDVSSVYEPAKCLEFDSVFIEEIKPNERQKLDKFLQFSARSLEKHVEDVKREAIKRPEDFLRSLRAWRLPKVSASSEES